MTVRSKDQLDELFTDAAVQGESNEITAEQIRDFVDSKSAVGGTLYSEDDSHDITNGWTAVANWDGVIGGKGFTVDTVAGTATAGSGIDDYVLVDAGVSVSSPAVGDLQIALTKNGGLTPFRSKVTVPIVDATVHLTVQGAGNLADGDVIGLAWKGSGSATLTIDSRQFRWARP